MAQPSHVPTFGNWDNEENVPYTMYFDKARKGRTGGKMINPNDPQENPDLLPENPLGPEAVRTTYKNRRSKEDGDLRQFRDSPARNDDTSRRAATESAHQQAGRVVGSSESYKTARNSVGSGNSFEGSPLHHHARNAGRGGVDSSSPSWEAKSVSKNSLGTPVRSRMRPTPRGDGSPDRGAAVPKFGDWDENNPSSADGFTHIFNKVREERNSAVRAPGMRSPSPQRNFRRPTNNGSGGCCCFPWGKK